MPEQPLVWRTVWVPYAGKRLFMVADTDEVRWSVEVPWGQPEHAGVVIAAPNAITAEIMLASLVAPELVVAYANIQRREPSLN